MSKQTNQNNQNAGGKKSGKAVSTRDIKYEECDDLFLGEKGRKLRNHRKKLEKYVELQTQVKTGEVKPNQQQKEQIASIAQVKQEIQELEDLCVLYIKSNPGFLKKEKKGRVTGADVSNQIESALAMIAQVQVLKALHREDQDYVEATDSERASIDVLVKSFQKMVEDCASGSDSFQQDEYRNDFVQQFSLLAQKSEDCVGMSGVTYAETHAFVKRSFDADESSKTHQRIADFLLAKVRKQQEEEEAERVAQEFLDAQKAQAAKIARAEREANAEADKLQKEKDWAAKKAEDEKARTSQADGLFDMLCGDYGDESEEEVKPVPEPKKEEAPVEKPVAKPEQESQPAAKDGQDNRGRGGRDGGFRRGGGRGGERRDDNRDNRQYDGERRGGRGGRGGGRGGGFKKEVEDEDGFQQVTEGNKSERRGRGGRGGERRGGDRRGGRGDGEWRNSRGGDRGGDRPRGERRGGRGDDRGDRGGRGDDRGERGGRGGDRPQTGEAQN